MELSLVIEDEILEQLFNEEIGSVSWLLLIRKILASTGLTGPEIEKAIKECKNQSKSLSSFKECVRHKLKPSKPKPHKP